MQIHLCTTVFLFPFSLIFVQIITDLIVINTGGAGGDEDILLNQMLKVYLIWQRVQNYFQIIYLVRNIDFIFKEKKLSLKRNFQAYQEGIFHVKIAQVTVTSELWQLYVFPECFPFLLYPVKFNLSICPLSELTKRLL